jgi:hypothetical protein
MRATFDHSWQLLTPEEQDALAQLSVFRGGFRREAAEAVARASLALLSALADRSWLRALPSGRYQMHELVRQYCAERLEAGTAGDIEGVRDQHSRYYGAFCGEREGRLLGGDQVRALQEVLEDMDNVRAAWRWAVERGDVEAIGGSVFTLWYVAQTRGWFHEMYQAYDLAIPELRRQLATAPDVDPARDQTTVVLASTLFTQAEMCMRLVGLGEPAVSLCQESLALLRGVDHSAKRDLVCVGIKVTLGSILRRSRQHVEGKRLHREALALAEHLGDPFLREAALRAWLGSCGLRAGMPTPRGWPRRASDSTRNSGAAPGLATP